MTWWVGQGKGMCIISNDALFSETVSAARWFSPKMNDATTRSRCILPRLLATLSLKRWRCYYYSSYYPWCRCYGSIYFSRFFCEKSSRISSRRWHYLPRVTELISGLHAGKIRHVLPERQRHGVFLAYLSLPFKSYLPDRKRIGYQKHNIFPFTVIGEIFNDILLLSIRQLYQYDKNRTYFAPRMFFVLRVEHSWTVGGVF